MSVFVIEKSGPLKGEINIDGAKNSALPIIAACLLCKKGEFIIENVPKLSDVETMCEIISDIGANIIRDNINKNINIECSNIYFRELPYKLVKKIRASFLLAGPMLARFKRVKIHLPGGCEIGIRPVDLHLKGFALLGADIKQEHGVIEISCNELKGNKIHLDFPSVGATENIIMAAVMAKGETIISNCAVEPEIVDLADFLNKMGCKIEGAGSDNIKITGVNEISSCRHRIIPDRIEAGTFLAAAAATRGRIKINNVCCEHLRAVTSKLRELNAQINEGDDFVIIDAENISKNADIKTMPYPGFPTDMQPQFLSVLTTIDGTGIVNETIFENRFMHVGELNRMGADIKLEGRCAVIQGGKRMTGTQVKATDLRAGAGLIIAALCAEGQSEIGDIFHIERGYCNIDEKLKELGADIRRADTAGQIQA